ncbi:MotA/TolQ/ExbB proton channel family protein [Myxacorys almedinensis]|uniref:MotA/TolQ/ExbB proton channel family protein n=1 Tax=Myxacorys almedinensis A TaxID=2690445 RepID=A0A8J7YYP6_9CYAN|nr:MotA/TolQ/ExbB proton channel family protein [Myxacorys almedinensis]NDJ16509.1 MotA/TolQ/ExbB proton channel family protein [Myxacorys almedinensis A]
MSNLYEAISKGGVTVIPLMGLSVATLACALDRSVFWFQLLRTEARLSHDILEASRYSLVDARAIAERSKSLPLGRFLLAPLKLQQPTPETFRLAMETAGDEEFAKMRKGDKLLETVVALAPLLGLLGTVTGLILTFNNLNIGGGGGSADTTKAAAGIGESLTSTAVGMVVAILALCAFRISVTLQAQQVEYFSKVGGELELIYRQVWYEPFLDEIERASAPEVSLRG